MLTDLALPRKGKHHYIPDVCLAHDPNGKNILIDVEVDEPYEGINNLQTRKPTHFQGSDNARNKGFTKRGWIVVRFAEIQVHQSPKSCCRLLAEVLASLDKDYKIPEELLSIPSLLPLKQWTREEAIDMSMASCREQYLGITRFGITEEGFSELEISSNEDELAETYIRNDPLGSDSDLGNGNATSNQSLEKITTTTNHLPEQLSSNVGLKTNDLEMKPDPTEVLATPKGILEKELPKTPHPPINLRPVRLASTDTLTIIRWAIEHKKYLYFIDTSFGNTIIDGFQPTSTTNELVTGFWHKEQRLTQRPIRYIKNLIVQESTH